MAYVQVILYVDDDLAAWLDKKARQGYKKASPIRKILDDYHKAEAVRNDGG
jgi:predicted nucleotidyltransferase